MMAMAAGPMTPVKDPNDQGEGNEQQDKEQTWEGMEPLGGAAAGKSFLPPLCLAFMHAWIARRLK